MPLRQAAGQKEFIVDVVTSYLGAYAIALAIIATLAVPPFVITIFVLSHADWRDDAEAALEDGIVTGRAPVAEDARTAA